MTPRIGPIDPPYPPEVQAEFDKLMRGAPPLDLFRTVARNPRVLQRRMGPRRNGSCWRAVSRGVVHGQRDRRPTRGIRAEVSHGGLAMNRSRRDLHMAVSLALASAALPAEAHGLGIGIVVIAILMTTWPVFCLAMSLSSPPGRRLAAFGATLVGYPITYFMIEKVMPITISWGIGRRFPGCCSR
jgi:hypothetical protein